MSPFESKLTVPMVTSPETSKPNIVPLKLKPAPEIEMIGDGPPLRKAASFDVSISTPEMLPEKLTVLGRKLGVPTVADRMMMKSPGLVLKLLPCHIRVIERFWIGSHAGNPMLLPLAF